MPDYTKKELAEALEISEKSVLKYINLGKINGGKRSFNQGQILVRKTSQILHQNLM